MEFKVEETLRGTADRLLSPVAAVIVGLYVIASLLFSIGQQTLIESALEEGQFEGTPFDGVVSIEDVAADLPLAVDVSESVGALIWIVGFVSIFAVLTVGLILLGATAFDFSEESGKSFAWKWINLFFGTIVFSILFSIGLALFIIPGLVLLVVLFYYPAAIGIDGESFVSAYGSSVDIFSENMLGTVILVLAWTLIAITVQGIAFVIGSGLPTAIDILIDEVATGVVAVFLLALVVEVYQTTQTREQNKGDELLEDPPKW